MSVSDIVAGLLGIVGGCACLVIGYIAGRWDDAAHCSRRGVAARHPRRGTAVAVPDPSPVPPAEPAPELDAMFTEHIGAQLVAALERAA